MDFNDFLKKALDRNPETRPTAAQLLEVRKSTLVNNPYNIKAFQGGVCKRTNAKETATAEHLIAAVVASCPTG